MNFVKSLCFQPTFWKVLILKDIKEITNHTLSQVLSNYPKSIFLFRMKLIGHVTKRRGRLDFGHTGLFEIKAGKIIFVLIMIRRRVWPFFRARVNHRFANKGFPSRSLKTRKLAIVLRNQTMYSITSVQLLPLYKQ